VLLALASTLPGLEHAGAAEPKAEGARRLPPLQVRIRSEEVDLEAGQLVVRLSRPASRVTLKLLSLSGSVLCEVEQHFDAAPAGSPLTLRWSALPAAELARIEVFGHDVFDYYAGIAITPWSFEIPHEDVVFDNDSAQIVASERRKLEASLAAIKKELPLARRLGTVTLFILAHTDSVGVADYNLQLSKRRAQAIGRWFRAQGLALPIAYAGLGEKALKIQTADEVAEPRNRRVDYMLGIEPPRFKKSGTVPEWQRM
jgi:outer membrane protein OmpA-like peptidoglycan-associated protein